MFYCFLKPTNPNRIRNQKDICDPFIYKIIHSLFIWTKWMAAKMMAAKKHFQCHKNWINSMI